MVIMGVVQSLMALMTISPNLSDQFSALVNLAVVTNVVPYIIALSALPVMMKTAGVAESKYRSTMFIATVAMLYSAYAIYAAGKDAVFGGMLVMALGFIVWGFIAYRFSVVKKVVALASCVAFLVLASPVLRAQQTAPAASSSTSTLDRIRSAGRIRLGYRADARPFSYKDELGQAAGYGVALCQKIAERRRPSSTRDAGRGVDSRDARRALYRGEGDDVLRPAITLVARRTCRSPFRSSRVVSRAAVGGRARPPPRAGRARRTPRRSGANAAQILHARTLRSSPDHRPSSGWAFG
jgi:hypothetical protein